MTSLQRGLRTDLTASMKARDELRTATLRMALAAIQTESVSGTTAHELSDDEVVTVLLREAKKRRESAEAFESAGRSELADRERAEGAILATYLPAELTDEAITTIVSAVISELGVSGMSAMGTVMKAAQQRVAGGADGRRLSAEVRRQLGA